MYLPQSYEQQQQQQRQTALCGALDSRTAAANSMYAAVPDQHTMSTTTSTTTTTTAAAGAAATTAFGCVECSYKCASANKMCKHMFLTRHGLVKCPYCNTYCAPRAFYAGVSKLIERARHRPSSAPWLEQQQQQQAQQQQQHMQSMLPLLGLACAPLPTFDADDSLVVPPALAALQQPQPQQADVRGTPAGMPAHVLGGGGGGSRALGYDATTMPYAASADAAAATANAAQLTCAEPFIVVNDIHEHGTPAVTVRARNRKEFVLSGRPEDYGLTPVPKTDAASLTTAQLQQQQQQQQQQGMMGAPCNVSITGFAASNTNTSNSANNSSTQPQQPNNSSDSNSLVMGSHGGGGAMMMVQHQQQHYNNSSSSGSSSVTGSSPVTATGAVTDAASSTATAASGTMVSQPVRTEFRCMTCLTIFASWTQVTKHVDTTKHTCPHCAHCGNQLKCYGSMRPMLHEAVTAHRGFIGFFYTRNDYLLSSQHQYHKYHAGNHFTGLSSLQYRCVCGVTFLHPLHIAEHLRNVHHVSCIADRATCHRHGVTLPLAQMIEHMRTKVATSTVAPNNNNNNNNSGGAVVVRDATRYATATAAVATPTTAGYGSPVVLAVPYAYLPLPAANTTTTATTATAAAAVTTEASGGLSSTMTSDEEVDSMTANAAADAMTAAGGGAASAHYAHGGGGSGSGDASAAPAAASAGVAAATAAAAAATTDARRAMDENMHDVEVHGFRASAFLQYSPLRAPYETQDRCSLTVEGVPWTRPPSYVVLYQCRECLYLFTSWVKMTDHINDTGHCRAYCVDCKAYLPALQYYTAADNKGGVNSSSSGSIIGSSNSSGGSNATAAVMTTATAMGGGRDGATTYLGPLQARALTLPDYIAHLQQHGNVVGFPASPDTLEALVDLTDTAYRDLIDAAPSAVMRPGDDDNAVLTYQCPGEAYGCCAVFLYYGDLVDHFLATGHHLRATSSNNNNNSGGGSQAADDAAAVDTAATLASLFPMVSCRATFTVRELLQHFGFVRCVYCSAAFPHAHLELHQALCVEYFKMLNSM